MRLLFTFAIVACSLACCKPYPSPTPPTDAGVAPEASVAPPPLEIEAGSPGTQDCANLARLQCKEATPNCAAVFDHIITAKQRPLDAACIANAKSKEEVRGCVGGILCP